MRSLGPCVPVNVVPEGVSRGGWQPSPALDVHDPAVDIALLLPSELPGRGPELRVRVIDGAEQPPGPAVQRAQHAPGQLARAQVQQSEAPEAEAAPAAPLEHPVLLAEAVPEAPAASPRGSGGRGGEQAQELPALRHTHIQELPPQEPR